MPLDRRRDRPNSLLHTVALWVALIALDTSAQLLFKSAAARLTPSEPSFQWVQMVAQSPHFWAAVVCLLMTFLVWMLILRRSRLGLSFAARVVISAVVLVPTGFLMGFPFPLGMASYSEEHKPWLWAVNGAASVLASVFSLALSIEVGFTMATTIGVGFYLVGYALLVRRSGRAVSEGSIVGAS